VDVSVVIATRNRVEELLHTLARLDSLPERPEVVVVDNGSSDGTALRAARALPRARVIALDANRGAAARNAGARAATTPCVAFCDDDSWWAPGALTRAAELLDAHPRVGLLAGRVLNGPEHSLDPACAAMAASPLRPARSLPGRRVLGFVACGAVVRREAFLQAGGFAAPAGVGGEEALLAADLADLGWQLLYVDDLVAHHHPSSVRDPARRRATVVRNALWFAWLRRPPGAVVRTTLAALRAGARDPSARRGVREAFAQPGLLAHRRRLSPDVEADLRRLERRPMNASVLDLT
jgi:GT2 family glycosyltransferase